MSTAKRPSPYTITIESIAGQVHHTIPPDAYTYQADVETVHNLVEMELYELETFTDTEDFLNKPRTYHLFFTLMRPNSYKEGKTPWQLAKQEQPHLPMGVAMIPPVLIEDLMDTPPPLVLIGDHNVASTPGLASKGLKSATPSDILYKVIYAKGVSRHQCLSRLPSP